jgi:hypothetical protein
LIQISACYKRDVNDHEMTIQRQEDYKREDASDTEVLPIHKNHNLKFQRDDAEMASGERNKIILTTKKMKVSLSSQLAQSLVIL